MSPVTPPFPSLISFASTGASLLCVGSVMKIMKIFSSFILKTSFETGSTYLTSYLLGKLCDKVAPNTSFKSKIIFVNLFTFLSGFFVFRTPITSLASSIGIFTLQSYTQDPYIGLSRILNRLPSFSEIYRRVTQQQN